MVQLAINLQGSTAPDQRNLAVLFPAAYGIDKARWDALLSLMAKQALASGSPGNNPRVPGVEEIVGLYWAIFGSEVAADLQRKILHSFRIVLQNWWIKGIAKGG